MNDIELDAVRDTVIEAIDSQHKQIFDRLNNYLAATAGPVSRDELINLLEDIHDRLSAHFSYEEGLLSERRQLSTSHLSKHVQLSDRLRQCVIRLKSNECGAVDVHSVLLSVYDWYIDHLESDDAVFYTSRNIQ